MPVPANFKGKKGRSGTKSLAKRVEEAKEKIKEEALIELANRVVFKQLQHAELTESAISAKEFAMPIVLKGMTEKKDLTSKGESLGVIVLPQKNADTLGGTTETGASVSEE